jgi:Uncharacterised nucleotidyltransferase
VSRAGAAWLPSPTQLLLLRASLWRDQRAVSAWAEWRRQQPDLDAVEAGSYRLLPLLYRNLGPQLADSRDAEQLKDIYRRSWTANQLGLRTARKAIDALTHANIEVLVLKGAALIGTAYGDPGARPMGDVDLAVPPAQVNEAVRALREAGFAASEDDPKRLLTVRHSLAFHDTDGQELDLHRGLLWRVGLEQEFWQESIDAEVAGARVRILNPADQLLHVCAHGAAWNPVHPLRWAADAFKVIEAADAQLDWGRLVATAKGGRLTLPLHDCVAFLATALEAPVPTRTVRELATSPVSRGGRRAHKALALPPSSRRSVAMLWWFLERYRAQAQLEGKRPRPSDLIRHLQGFWGLERAAQVPPYAARRLLRRRTDPHR